MRLALAVFAAVWSLPAAAIVFDDFSDVSALTLNGSAAGAATADGAVLRLTPAQGNSAGSAFGTAQVSAAQFQTSFTFRITEPGGIVDQCSFNKVGADGLVFVVQNVSASIGGLGKGIGYGGIPDSVGVEFDTYCNGATDGNLRNHVGIDIEGFAGQTEGLPAVAVTPDFDDGNLWHAWVEYDGTTLSVRVSQSPARPVAPTTSAALDIPAILGAETAYIGFTSATGGAWGAHDILRWQYDERFCGNGEVTFAQDAYEVGEAGLDLAIGLTRSGILDGTATVNVEPQVLGARQAQPWEDFDWDAARAVFAPGADTATALLPIFEDALDESSERLRLVLRTPSEATCLGRNVARARIADNDPQPFVSFERGNSSIDEGGGGNVIVVLSVPSGRSVTVPLTYRGTARTDEDYLAGPAAITFPPGQTRRNVRIQSLDDALDEPNERVVLQLGESTTARVRSPANHQVTIRDDDPPPE